MTSNACDTVGDDDGGERGALRESIISNARYAIRDGDGGEQGAISESIISYTFNAIRDRCIFAASNKGVSRCFNYRITIITAIINNIPFVNFYFC